MLRRHRTSIEARLQALPPWRTLLKRLVIIYIAYLGLYAANGAFMGCQASTIALTVFPVRQLVFMPRLIDFHEDTLNDMENRRVTMRNYTDITEHGTPYDVSLEEARLYFRHTINIYYTANCRTLDLMLSVDLLHLILRN